MDNITAREEKKIPYIDDIRFEHGTLFIGTEGWVAVSRDAWKVYPESLYKKAKEPGKIALPASEGHIQDFVDAVLSREKPLSDLQSAVYSDCISHLCDIAIRTGRSITWDPENETIAGDDEAEKMMSRPMREPWSL
jgi:hypothetical protein